MTLRYLSSFFITVLLFLMLFDQSCCFSMDPRFELDPAQVSKNSGIKASKPKKVRYSRVRKIRKPATTAIKKNRTTKHPSSLLHLPASAENVSKPDLHSIVFFWSRLLPTAEKLQKPLSFKTDSFDLTIDPTRYPQLEGADGGRLLLDTAGTLPPLIRSLIQEKDPSIKILTANLSDGRTFLRSLLKAGGFYSVEEHPVMTFGTDQMLKIRSDFKVERTAESVLRNELMLVNAAHQALPVRLNEYLKKQGFELLEPFAVKSTPTLPLMHRLVYSVNAVEHLKSVDFLLDTLAIPSEKKRRIELFSVAQSGIGLSVVSDRYFERNGKRYVVTEFTGDPVAYTLLRLLETKGFRVVILEQKDNFRTITSKLLARMELPSNYASHELMTDPDGRYSLQASGFLIENATPKGGLLMLTDQNVEKDIQELLNDHGYQVQELNLP